MFLLRQYLLIHAAYSAFSTSGFLHPGKSEDLSLVQYSQGEATVNTYFGEMEEYSCEPHKSMEGHKLGSPALYYKQIAYNCTLQRKKN
jgi:hypothetical protein